MLMKSKIFSRPPKIILYQTIITPMVCCGCETWILGKLQRFERKLLSKIFSLVKDPSTGKHRTRSNAELDMLYKNPNKTTTWTTKTKVKR